MTQSAIVMTTANGVDTQPVLRGVWVLENIIGAHLPPPTTDLPALTPDTQAATTPRELLARPHERRILRQLPQTHRSRRSVLSWKISTRSDAGAINGPKSKKSIDPSGGTPRWHQNQGRHRSQKMWLVGNVDQFGLLPLREAPDLRHRPPTQLYRTPGTQGNRQRSPRAKAFGTLFSISSPARRIRLRRPKGVPPSGYPSWPAGLGKCDNALRLVPHTPKSSSSR